MRPLAFLLSHLPLPLAALLCRGLAWVWWLLIPVRKPLAIDNLQRALPELPPGPTLRAAFASLSLGFVELLQVPRGTVTMRTEGAEQLILRGQCGQGSVLVGAHSAGFEAATHLMAQIMPVAVFVRPPRNPRARALMESLRGSLELLPPHGSMPLGYERLAAGRVLLFAIDQARREGIAVPFFGRPAMTSPGPAAAALRTGVPVFCAWISRERPGRLVGHIEHIEMSGDVERDTATLARWQEARIRREPGAWLWLHDRWKTP